MSSTTHFESSEKRRSRAGFTLTEILAVIVTIAVLIALIYPGLRAARNRALMTVCVGNEKSIYTGIAGYASENNGLFPMWEYDLNSVYSHFWIWDIAPYVGIPTSGNYAGSAAHCPADPLSYALSYSATGVSVGANFYYPWGIYVNYPGYYKSCPPEYLLRMKHPDSTVILAEKGDAANSANLFYPYNPAITVANQTSLAFLHGDYMNCLFGDGHVEAISVQTYNADVTSVPPKKPFVYQP